VTRILVLNAGSSSLKASVLDLPSKAVPTPDAPPAPLASTAVSWGSDATRVSHRRATVAAALEQLWQAGIDATTLRAAAHRVVHGGTRYTGPTLVDEAVLAALSEAEGLAPLHNAVAIDTIKAQRELLPGLRAIAVFDTAFHAGLEEEAFVYPLPWRWYEEWGIRRFGFHGLSVAWSVRRAAQLLDRPAADLRLVVAHLGSGCSVTAVAGGRSVSTSMGLTPLEGLAMGTRSGSVDPGILLHVLRERGMSADELADVLDHQSGLLGISGVSGSMEEVAAAAAGGTRRAQLAIDIFVRRAAAGIAVAAASLPRLDGLVFTGGIGEHSASMRAAITSRLATLNVPPVPADGVPDDAVLTPAGATVAVLRVAAREDVVMAEAVAEIS
jgi:acetate kinase